VRTRRYLIRGILIAVAAILAACPRNVTDPSFTLTVSPPTAQLFVADSVRFTAQVRDASGAVTSLPLTWSIDNPAVASIDSTGLVRALAAGSATIRVAAQGETASASVVVAFDSGQTLSIAPGTVSMYVNGFEQLAATVKDRNGKTVTAPVRWETSNSAVATVDANGVVTAVTTGSATVRASARGLTATATVTVSAAPASVVLVGAGDIARCSGTGDEATARLLDGISGTVFTAGDNAYDDGTPAEYTDCYGPSWGRHKSRTKPTIGNHEYQTPDAAGYFGYFGTAFGTGPTIGYYSYNLGAWHIVVLNSNIAMSAGSPQENWLRADLAAHPAKCTLAMWHHPRFSSGEHGSSTASQPLWQALYDAGADVVVSGHDHDYERFSPQTSDGEVDAARGLRQFVVGTGGGALYGFDHPAANSEVKNNATLGVLKLTLYPDRYDWKFVPVAGSSFTDAGTGRCH
jgi:hypothetical protein